MKFDRNTIANYTLDNILTGNYESDIGYSFKREEYFELDNTFQDLMNMYLVETKEEAEMLFQNKIKNKTAVPLTWIKEDFIKNIDFVASQLNKTREDMIKQLKEDDLYRKNFLKLLIRYAKPDFDYILEQGKLSKKAVKKK